MRTQKTWLKRTFTVVTGVALLVGGTALPAQAYGMSTTGARGDVENSRPGSGAGGYPYAYDLYATDTLSDGHCARWQLKIGSGAWQWFGTQSCGAKTYSGVGYGKAGYVYRICRTGVGNCSAPKEFA
jgi:hypothetical protein